MLKKLLILICLLGSTVFLNAQNEYNIWYFGYEAGLTFNTNPVSALSNSKMNASEASSGICDKNGKLLFYTSGDTIWNRNHQLMKNYQPTFSFLAISSARQGSIVLPVPGNEHQYYVFTGRALESFSKDSMLRYWTIDMNGDGGLGEVIEKEKPLLRRPNEAFGVTMHANNLDYWVAIFSTSRKTFECTRTTNGKFNTPPVTQKVIVNNFYDDQGAILKFSPDSKLICGNVSGKTPYKQFINIYPFDNATGALSTPIQLPFPNINLFLNFEFSSNSRFLYLSYIDGTGFADTVKVSQYDLSKWNVSAILASKVDLYKATYTGGGVNPVPCDLIAGLQLAPDGKIYCFNVACNQISVIDSPNLKGSKSGFKFRTITLNPKISSNGGPYYPNFWFKTDKLNLGNDTGICTNDSLVLDSKLIPYGRAFKWNTGDTTTRIKVKKSGQYILKITYPLGRAISDTINVKVNNKFKVYLGNDTAFCKQFSYNLNAGSGFKKYTWNTKDSSMQITVNQQGIYSVKVIDSNTCPLGDTIKIDEIKTPVITLIKDTITCQYIYLSVTRQPGITYSWNNGDTGISTKVYLTGNYTVYASHKFCSTKDSIAVLELPKPVVKLGPDTVICQPMILNTFEKGRYLWNTGGTTSSITVQNAGFYWLKVTRNNCFAYDTIALNPCENMTCFVPDAFSPNGDQINDVFTVTGKNIKDISLSVYNRWGELLMKDNGTTASWDGSYKGTTCQESVYFYTIHLTGYNNGRLVNKYLKGSFTLLR